MAKSAAAAAGAYFGARALLGAISSSIELFKEQELAEKKLEAALGKTSQALLNQASALQRVSMFGDEAIIGAQAMLGAFVRDEEAIALATEATMDLAAAKGFDLVAAADLVSKTLGSSTNALTRYGIEVKGAVGSTARLTSLTENIAKVFGGQAAAQAQTLTGATTQLTNAFGDLQETLVTNFAPALENSARTATSFIEAITLSLKINQLEAQKSTEAYIALGDAALLQSLIAEKALIEQQLLLEQNPILIIEFIKAYRDSIPKIVEAQVPMLKGFRKVADLLGFTTVVTDDMNAAWIGFKDSFKDDEDIRDAENVIADLTAKIEELRAKIAGDGEDGEDDPVVTGFEAYEETMNKKFALMQEEQAQNEINQKFMAQFIADNEDVAAALGLVTDATKAKIAIEKKGAENFKTNLEKSGKESTGRAVKRKTKNAIRWKSFREVFGA